ncbi:Purple acid phosphatase [Aphelenchoides bicaudatus]|nr:Purple acid phosphatase [Aphelenchoides bicaudatus]
MKSREFSFVGIAKRKGGYRYAIFGDFGLKNAHKENGTVGDNFMQMIEPIASSLPYMTTPGNHEIEYNFTHYANRFTMPLDTANQCFDHGFAHFVMFSTEVYFAHTRISPEFMIRQYKWLVEDLRKANENRKNVPWIVTFGHRPMYCSSEVAAYGVNDCHLVDSVIRKGIIGVKSLGLEDLFYKNGVDLEIWGHVHAYSRSWPVYDYKIYNGSKSPYVDPRAPITTGSAGCNELVENFTDPKNFDAYLSSHYGIGVMKIANKTHLHWQQFAAVKNLVDDDIWIVKNKHGPYN